MSNNKIRKPQVDENKLLFELEETETKIKKPEHMGEKLKALLKDELEEYKKRDKTRAAEMIGIVKDRSLATSTSPAYPKIGFVSEPQDWVNPEGVQIHKEDVDITARLCSMQKMHRAYMVTGAICTGAASKIPGTLVYEAMSERAHKSDTLLIGQPYGPMEVITAEKDGKIISGGVYRTARKILDGAVYIPESRMK